MSPPPESDLIDEILLAAGKALYLANQFEFKCGIVLKVAYAEEALKDDPVLSLEELATKIPDDRMLGGTLQDLAKIPPGMREHESLTLEKARYARNYIAHEGAGAIGELWSYGVQQKLDALRKLHAKVIDLAKGYSIVSTWIRQIEELGKPLLSSIDPDWAENWVFSHIPHEWLDPEWKPDHQPPRTIMAAMSYEPWYSRRYSRPCQCPHDADDD
jgi:hypothetical protein